MTPSGSGGLYGMGDAPPPLWKTEGTSPPTPENFPKPQLPSGRIKRTVRTFFFFQKISEFEKSNSNS